MRRTVIVPFALAGFVVFAPVNADDLTGANKLLCAAASAAACCDDGECASGTADELNIPQFLEIDVAAKRISTTKASGDDRSSTVANLKRENGHILLQGMERGRAYSILIDEKSGGLSAAVAGSFGCGVTVFGSCTPMK